MLHLLIRSWLGLASYRRQLRLARILHQSELYVAGSGAGLATPPGYPACSECSGFFCHQDHPLTRRPDVAREDIANFPMISTRLPDAVHLAFREAFQVPPDEPGPFALTCDNIFLLKRVLQSGDAVLCTARQIVAEDLAAGNVVELPVPNPYSRGDTRWEMDVVYLSGRTLSPAALMVIKLLQKLSAQLEQQPT